MRYILYGLGLIAAWEVLRRLVIRAFLVGWSELFMINDKYQARQKDQND